MKSKKKIDIADIISRILRSLCVCTLAYILISRGWNMYVVSDLATGYSSAVQDKSQEVMDAEYQEAIDYNNAHPNNTFGSTDDEAADPDYANILNTTGNGMIGYVEVPSIGIDVPIYHGTSDDVLSKGIGHMYGTSFPVGGFGTHAVLAGHRGLPTSKLFTDLDKVKLDDTFVVHILNRDLYYRVDQIEIVLPDDMEYVQTDPDHDYVTLLTCTPYGVNSHRLLVRGTRIQAPTGDRKIQQAQRNWYEELYHFFTRTDVSYALAILALILVIIFLIKIWMPDSKKKKKSEKKSSKRAPSENVSGDQHV